MPCDIGGVVGFIDQQLAGQTRQSARSREPDGDSISASFIFGNGTIV